MKSGRTTNDREDAMSIFSAKKFHRLALLTFAGFFFCATAWPASAQQSFSTADEAASALIDAARSDKSQALLKVLGSAGKSIIASGDEVADKKAREDFLAAYDVQHKVIFDNPKTGILLVGTQAWPFPIPIIQKDKGWEFDTALGRREILYRRIGRNELDAIQVCLAYVDAQNDYATAHPEGDDKAGSYAQKIISSAGKKDGLYWPASANELQSPLGAAVADATAEGYSLGNGPVPYHGYYYKILTRQGSAAPGGELNYIVNGKMIGGFALIAYPAEYGNSGVMTFLVSHTGAVYEKDLGVHTREIASATGAFNPDHTWKIVNDAEKQR